MRVIDFILCDDVRSELGNKVSIVGVYSDSVRVQAGTVFPIQIFVATFVRIRMERDGEPFPDTYVTTISNNGVGIGELRSAFLPEHRNKKILQVIGQIRPLVIPATGSLDFKVDLLRDGAPLIEPYTYSVSVLDDAPP